MWFNPASFSSGVGAGACALVNVSSFSGFCLLAASLLLGLLGSWECQRWFLEFPDSGQRDNALIFVGTDLRSGRLAWAS